MTSILDWKGRLRVRLTVDLTKYHRLLVVGVEGTVSDFSGTYKVMDYGRDRFWQVEFPDAGIWDILPDSLDIIDEEYLRWEAENKKRKAEKRVTKNLPKTLANVKLLLTSGSSEAKVELFELLYEYKDTLEGDGYRLTKIKGDEE